MPPLTQSLEHESDDMNNYFRFCGVLLFLLVLSGCSNHQRPFKDLSAIIDQLERDRRQDPGTVTIVERPENSGPFQVGISFTCPVGREAKGKFTTKDKQDFPFQYPKVEGKYYVVTPLTDTEGKISLLVTLLTDKSASHDEPAESTESETP